MCGGASATCNELGEMENNLINHCHWLRVLFSVSLLNFSTAFHSTAFGEIFYVVSRALQPFE